MGIPLGNAYHAKLKGSMRKDVRCESCGAAYLYFVEREAHGAASSPLWLDNAGAAERASDRAERKLASSLEVAIELAPCPVCGRFPAYMVADKRKSLIYSGIAAFAVPMIGVVIIAFVYKSKSMPYSPGELIAMCGGAWLVPVGLVIGSLLAWFNPHKGRFFPFGKKGVHETMTPQQLEELELQRSNAKASAADRVARAKAAARQFSIDKHNETNRPQDAGNVKS